MSISRITPSLIAASNENTVALVNVNADFSLIKLEAPNEFKELGRSLTHHRRELAEEGAVHRTARRLGALFESIAPLSPHVIKAYGTRVSEISRSHTNENSATRHGVFADCIGMDGTSVWAAATSGKSAITVHLLACMLARAWSGPQATSIWVEIVEARRQELKKQIHDGIYNDYTQVGLAASADLTRTDLAQWDASARSWLQVADDELVRRQKQLMLIINNINMPVNHGTSNFSTYARVVEAWKTAVEALEKLLQGQPQRLSKGSVLLGLASWHLYPDLLILGESVTTVDFKDSIIADCAQLTIGLWNPDSDKDEGVYWSLSLSHLRFYGDPVKVTSITTRDASRLNIEELHLLTMGAFLADWGNLRVSDITNAAHFFVALDDAVCAEKGSPLNVDLDWNWIHSFGDASRKFLMLPDTEKTVASSFVALGHRRGHSLLSKDTAQIPPIMGLCHPWIQQLLRQDMGDIPYLAPGAPGKDMAVEMMRYFAQHLELRHDECIIMMRDRNTYTTAIPHIEGTRSYHINWVEFEAWSWDHSCRCLQQGHACHPGHCQCLDQNIKCSSACHSEDVVAYSGACSGPGCLRGNFNFDKTKHIHPPEQTHRTKQIHQCSNIVRGEAHRYVRGKMFDPMSPDQILPPSDLGIQSNRSKSKRQKPQSLRGEIAVSRPYGIVSRPHATHQNRALCGCFYSEHAQRGPNFVLIAGSADHVALLVRTDSGVRARKSRLNSAQRRAQTEPLHTVEQVTQAIRAGALPARSLANYFISLRYGNQIAVPTFHKGLVVKTFTIEPYLQSLRALALATKTFKDLPGSTISLGIISTPLHDALWLPPAGVQFLNRQQKFACIAMFESGTYNIEPTALNDVIAISSRNSIFTSKLLHHDPSSIGHKDDITRVIGNVGKTGMVLMVAPQAPRLRKIDLNNFRLVSHTPFDGKSEDSFKSTSLHLRFTEFEMAFDVGQRGAIDKALCLVETLIQVYDRDEWIADIDVLPLFSEGNDAIRRNTITCKGCSLASQPTDIPSWLVSIDNWEELLDAPKGLGKLNVAVFRAHDNWIARLAAACVSLQRGFRIVINPADKVCWGCCCRKKWGWSAETLSLSRHAALSHFDSDDLDDNDCDDSDEGDSLESSESDTSGSSHSETSTQSDTSSSNVPDLETRSIELSSQTGLAQEALRQFDIDPGYESDDTVFNMEWETQLHHMPQVFIL
ncbi:hypothetical protein IG631_13952 [Alternaria alternata]|nr:hypothetical protein IG631_13952 [Alternaria alternata]